MTTRRRIAKRLGNRVRNLIHAVNKRDEILRITGRWSYILSTKTRVSNRADSLVNIVNKDVITVGNVVFKILNIFCKRVAKIGDKRINTGNCVCFKDASIHHASFILTVRIDSNCVSDKLPKDCLILRGHVRHKIVGGFFACRQRLVDSFLELNFALFNSLHILQEFIEQF